MQIMLNDDWAFARDVPENFRPVRLPHDWLIANKPSDWYLSGIGWYQRKLDTSGILDGQRVFLHFDGVYMDSTLYVNAQKAGEWKCGFTAFEIEITGLLSPDGRNELMMKVDCRYPSARWYTGAGIYRDVSLIIRNRFHIKGGSVYVTTAKKGGRWTFEASAEAENEGRPFVLRHSLVEDETIRDWSLEDPRLYTLKTELIVGGRIQDTVLTRIGFRSMDFSPQEGFSLNGRRMKLNGVCLHQEFSVLGAAVSPDIITRQFLSLKEMGVNAVRTAHNPPSAVFMDLADEMGMMVISEFSDVWEIGKTAHDYAEYFREWHQRDIESWIRRDRNRPSVIMWSLGNEVPDTHADYGKGVSILRKMADAVRLLDPRGRRPLTIGSNYMAWENTQRCAQELDAVGYNYSEYLYKEHHGQHPSWVIYGSETCSTVQSRGIYHFPLAQPLLSDDDLQCSSLGNSTTSWGTKSIETCIGDDRDASFSLGQFIWAGQDYLGEPTPYHTKNAYFGMLDTAGFKKDAFYLFKSAWTDPDTCPMIHLFPYWDFSMGQEIDVRICSNQYEVALFLDDEPLGRRKMHGQITQDFRILYRPGTLRAKAYDRLGNVLAQCARASFGEAVKLHLSYEHFSVLTFATITALDANDRPVENANRLVRVHVAGGELVGLDNGDAADLTPFPQPARRLFSGKLLAVIRRFENEELFVTAELDPYVIPVRKVELQRDGLGFSARLLPKNADPTETRWRLTNAAGIDSDLGELRADASGLNAEIIPKGDGDVFVRCGVMNGQEHISLYSQMRVALCGYGRAKTDPFSFVSAGLYTFSNDALGNGNERGIATLRNGRCVFGFDNLDFGESDSDSFSIWLFPLTKEPFHFEVWEGKPFENGCKLCDPLYDLGSIWNEYQELRIRLPRKLKGTTSLYFVFELKTHVKGFRFHDMSFDPIDASECHGIYGDSYRLSGMEVLDIGNNTTLVFRGLRFTHPGANRVEITWRSTKKDNPVRIIIESESGTSRTELNLSAMPQYGSRVFSLGETAQGNCTASFVFLPGCALDLKSVHFLQVKED